MTRELVHRQRPPAQRSVYGYQSRRRGRAARREPILRVEHRSFGIEHLQEVAGALLEPQARQAGRPFTRARGILEVLEALPRSVVRDDRRVDLLHRAQLRLVVARLRLALLRAGGVHTGFDPAEVQRWPRDHGADRITWRAGVAQRREGVAHVTHTASETDAGEVRRLRRTDESAARSQLPLGTAHVRPQPDDRLRIGYRHRLG